MSQAALFADLPKPPRRVAHVQTVKPAQPFGDKREGKYWYERFRDEIRTLPEDSQAVLFEMLLEWPAERTDAVRLMLDRWVKARPAERDNFMEAFGR